MMPCYRCGATAVRNDGICAHCGMHAFESPYALPSVTMRPRRNIQGLGTALTIVLGVTAATLLAVAAAQLWRHSLVTSVLNVINDGSGTPPQISTIQTSDNLVRITLILAGIGFVTSGILTICWLHAARSNAETYSPYVFSLGRGWAIGAWFIPIGSLFLPLRVALETHRGTVAGREPGKPSGGTVTAVWWTLWLAGYFGMVIAFEAGGSKDTNLDDPLHSAHSMQTTSIAVQPGLLLLTGAAIALLLYVRKVTRIQVARAGEPYGNGMPGFGPAPFGAPQFGAAPVAPAYGQPAYGQPGYGQPGYGQPAYGQPAYGQPTYGQPVQDQVPYGTPPSADPWAAPGTDQTPQPPR